MDRLESAINRQRDYIEKILTVSLGQVAALCETHWYNPARLDTALADFLKNRPEHHCRMLYAIDRELRQHSSNISDSGADNTVIGQNLSTRPYLDNIDKQCHSNLILSDVYIDRRLLKPCITALHSVSIQGEFTGYIAADFGLNDLPLREIKQNHPREWRQIKGDPSIRNTLFQQTRNRSAMDEHIDEVLYVVDSLMAEQGIFHAKLHFSSSRATLWPYQDPYRYQLHVLDEIIQPKVCLIYARVPYPVDAVISRSTIPNVLKGFKLLREADETVYLRSGSLNIMNGLVGLNFSCDGTHYMQAEEFVSKDMGFWFGQRGQKFICNT